MERLAIDFALKQRPLSARTGSVGIVAAFVGAIVFGMALWNHLELQEEQERLHNRLDDLRQETNKSPSGEQLSASVAAQVEQANAISHAARQPLAAVLSALENAYGSHGRRAELGENVANIVILSLSADTAKREISLSGEARDFSALNAFTRALAEQPVLSKVTLANHKLGEGKSPVVIQFVLRMSWGGEGK